MKTVGYGICGPGEASRYMRETMDDFARLCDVVVILLNNAGKAELDLVKEYGFKYVIDDREWGKLQWKIKQDFLQREVSKYADDGDMVVCLDMDETLDRYLTKDWLMSAELDAYHVFIVDLWNDEKHYKPESCFWNVRIFRWNGNIDFTKKPVHCGLAPEWARSYNRYAPFILIHKGLMLKSDRKRKIERYEKYDPLQQHLGKVYYAMLKSDSAVALDEEKLHATISTEVATYKQSRPRGPSIYMNNKPNERFAYFRNAAGYTVDVPEKHVALTMKQPGMQFIGWADDAAKEIEELLAEDDAPIVADDETPAAPAAPEAQAPAPRTTDVVEKNRVGVEAAPRPVKRMSKESKPAAKKVVKKASK